MRDYKSLNKLYVLFITVLCWLIVLSCRNNNESDALFGVSDKVQKVISLPLMAIDTFSLVENEFIIVHFLNNSEFRYCLLQKQNGRDSILIPFRDAFGGFLDTVIYTDYNFDGLNDIAILTQPQCRSGATLFQEVLICKGKNTYSLNPVLIDGYSYLDKTSKCIRTMCFGPSTEHIYSTLVWQNDTIVRTDSLYLEYVDGIKCRASCFILNHGKMECIYKNTTLNDIPEPYKSSKFFKTDL